MHREFWETVPGIPWAVGLGSMRTQQPIPDHLRCQQYRGLSAGDQRLVLRQSWLCVPNRHPRPHALVLYLVKVRKKDHHRHCKGLVRGTLEDKRRAIAQYLVACFRDSELSFCQV